MFFIAFVVILAATPWWGHTVVAASPTGTARVIGGSEAAIEQYPFVVSIRVGDQHNCGGSILTATSILTAGHCVADIDITRLTVRVGNALHAQGTPYNVSQYLRHGAYNAVTLENDIAILKLATPLTFGLTVQPISVLSGRPQPGAALAVIGWGMYGPATGSSKVLRAAAIQLVSQQTCQDFYKGTAIRLDSKVLCASSEDHSRNSCPGDSGGPLIHPPSRSLLGVVSFGLGCGTLAPAGYTSVPDFLPWIQRFG